jgi:hypothetical protein
VKKASRSAAHGASQSSGKRRHEESRRRAIAAAVAIVRTNIATVTNVYFTAGLCAGPLAFSTVEHLSKSASA